MCGIAGIITLHKTESPWSALVKRMMDTLVHRGPDGEGYWGSEDGSVHLGHRRLSIIDLSDNGAQPMVSGDRRFVITYNGEIYNYKELRKTCETLGSRFFSQSDTEVILECFRHWGCQAFEKFTGMWALAIYDNVERTVTLSRDPFAIKPFYYGFADGALYFASEPKALCRVHPRFEVVDDLTVQLFIENGYLERDEWTFYKHIKRFPQAHYCVISLDTRDQEVEPLYFYRYWHPPEKRRKMSMRDAAQELRYLLDNSIRLHLRSDVPVGACLSGGLDSSAIVCMGAKYLEGDKRWNTFTTHYPSFPEIDESQWAKRVIEYSHATAHFVEPTLERFISNFDRLLYYQDEPYGSTSIFAQYTVFEKISTTPVKVVLDGQGSDEQLAGYHGFLSYFLDHLLASHQYGAYLREGLHLHRRYNLEVKDRFKTHIRSLKQRHLHKRKQRQTKKASQIFSLPDWNSSFEDAYEARLKKLRLHEVTFDDNLTALVCETNLPQLLRYEDRNSMAFSIESRVPFLDKDLVNFCLALPATLKVYKGFTKAVLREALKDYIPESVRVRTDKLGFPTPERSFLKQAFDLDVQSNCSREWRTLITEKWWLQQKESMVSLI